jgi:hypothetical protein
MPSSDISSILESNRNSLLDLSMRNRMINLDFGSKGRIEI